MLLNDVESSKDWLYLEQLSHEELQKLLNFWIVLEASYKYKLSIGWELSEDEVNKWWKEIFETFSSIINWKPYDLENAEKLLIFLENDFKDSFKSKFLSDEINSTFRIYSYVKNLLKLKKISINIIRNRVQGLLDN